MTSEEYEKLRTENIEKAVQK